LPTIDIGTKKAFGSDYVPGSPCPIQVKGRLFASPGYLLSHHVIWLEMTYEDTHIGPGATVPVSLRARPGAAECFLKAGGGAIAEAKWRVGCPLLWVGGDIPYLPNFDLGFQAHVEDYVSPMPNAGYKVGARSSLGSGLKVPLYQVGSQGKIFLKLKPGLFFKLGFHDVTARVAVVGSTSVKDGQNAEILPGVVVPVAKQDTTGVPLTITLPNDLTDIQDFKLLLSSVDYQDDLKISPTVGFCLGVSVSLTSSDDEEEGEGGDGEPPDGPDNDYAVDVSSEVFDFGEVSLSLSEIGYTTPTVTWDLGATPGIGNLFQLGWNLPISKPNAEAAMVVPPLPDLVVPLASASADGGQFSVSAEVDNQGTGPAGGFQVRWFLEHANGSPVTGVTNPVWTDPITSLATGGYQTLPHSRDALPVGEYRVRIVADADGSAPYFQQTELNETNNHGLATFNSTLDLSTQFASGPVYRDAACTQAVATGYRLPGRPYYVKVVVSRRAQDVPAASVPVELWAQRHLHSWEGQGTGTAGGSTYYDGPSILIGRKVVDLSSATTANVVFGWTPQARLDANYELRVRVDPEGQINQFLAAGADTSANDLAWAWVRFARPHPYVSGLGVSPGPGHDFSDWGIGQQVVYSAYVHNGSVTHAYQVPVQLFVGGRMVKEQIFDIPSENTVEIDFQREFTRDDLYRDMVLGGGTAAPRVEMAGCVDPRDEIEDSSDDCPGWNTYHELMLTPPIGHLAVDVALPEEMYTGEAQAVTAIVANAYDQTFPGGALGPVPVSVSSVFGEGEAHQEALIQQGDVAVGVGESHGPVNGYHWYTPAVGTLEPASWVPQQPGQYLVVSTLTPPVPPDKASDPLVEKYYSDVDLFDNTVVKLATVGMPRPDLQALRAYVAAMPTRADLADLRRISGRLADAFSGSPRAKEILAVGKGKAYAGAPVTIALDLANPRPSDQYPVVPAPGVRVNFYATYQPEWQKRPVLADWVEQWRQIRDEQLPALGRPIRQLALCDSDTGIPSAGLWITPTHVSVCTPRIGKTLVRPVVGRADQKRPNRLLDNRQIALQYKGRDLFDLLRQFNLKQAEVRLIGTAFLDRVEDGAVVSCQWSPPHGGKWLISADIDPDETIMERDETNNSTEMILDVRPSPHTCISTPPCAIAGVRVGRGAFRSQAVESQLESQAGAEPAQATRPEIFPVDRGIQTLWDELRQEAEARTAGMPALAKRRAVTIRQGQTFTLIGSRTIDREHDVVHYAWTGPNVGEAGPYPDLVVDTSQPGRELSPGEHRFTLTAIDAWGFVSTDDIVVTVVKGDKNAADLVPVGLATLPSPCVAGHLTTLVAVVQNNGCGNTSKAFKVAILDGRTQVAEQTVSTPLNGGDAVEVAFEDAWTPTAGAHALTVKVDSDNQVAESSESNNTLTIADRIDGNANPVADLGAESFQVVVGEGLFLDAYRSFDPDGAITTYRWFINGTEQTGQHGRRFRYVAPARAGNQTVRLIVVDNGLPTPKVSEPFEATIQVVSDRQRDPVVRLPHRLVARRGTRVTIPAAGCYDPDGTLAAFAWKVLGATKLGGTQQDFVLDTKDLKPGRYVIELQVTDNAGASTKAQMPLYVVEPPNRAPVIQLPVAVSAVKGEPVTIDASRSYDVDGAVADFLWIVPKTCHVATGPKLQLDTGDLGVGAHVVTLAVSDNQGATTTRATTVWVLPTKGQPQQSETGYEGAKPLTEDEIKQSESRDEEQPASESVRPPSGAKPLRTPDQKKPPIEKR
jgi:hypothetical protein